MISKVVIAAAGQGTRMRHLCKNKPKSLIRVQKKPFLSYLFDNLLEAGYKEFILVVGCFADQMEKFLKECGYQATIVNQFDILGPKEKEYGTLCPIKCVKDLIGNENFVSIYGDNLFSVRDLQTMAIDDDFNYIGASVVDNPEKYGVLIVDEKCNLKEIIEKPKEYVGNLVNKGIYKFTPEIFSKIPLVSISPRGEYELTDAVTLLAKEGKVKVMMLKDYWMDFGNPGDVLKVSKFLKKRKIH